MADNLQLKLLIQARNKLKREKMDGKIANNKEKNI